MKNIISRIAFHSYSIVKIAAASAILIVSVLKYFFDLKLTIAVVAISFFVAGTFVGYLFAYYSIKFLRDEGIKKKLSRN